MGIFSKMFGTSKPAGGASRGEQKQAQGETLTHLRTFAQSHEGCEIYIEPSTRVTQTTVVLVAGSGEWTRRRVPDANAGRAVAKDLGVMAFDVNLSGYPSRMREWTDRQRRERDSK